MSNNPLLTDVAVNAFSDNYGAGFIGWIYAGCCPATNPNCHSGTPGGGVGGGHGFGFSFADPGGNPLPIELVDFNAKSENEIVRLNWSTALEINNDYFTIERSINLKDWMEIGRVQGAGNSTIINSYAFINCKE